MDPDDVGGDDILNTIKRDVIEILDSALKLSLNQMCYCKAILKRSHWRRPVHYWRCRSCFANQSRRVAYQCCDDECSFKRVSGWVYRVCPSCFEWRENNNFCDETDEKEDGMERTFICRRINWNISMIS